MSASGSCRPSAIPTSRGLTSQRSSSRFQLSLSEAGQTIRALRTPDALIAPIAVIVLPVPGWSASSVASRSRMKRTPSTWCGK